MGIRRILGYKQIPELFSTFTVPTKLQNRCMGFWCGGMEIDMNIVLLSGGSGKRLWPLSNNIRSKQFIKIFKQEDGSYESMVQRVYC